MVDNPSQESVTQATDEAIKDAIGTPPVVDKLYFGSREVESFGKGQMTNEVGTTYDSHLVWVKFADGSREVMHESEWEVRSLAPVQEDFNFDKRRLSKASEDLLALLRRYNIRLEDLMTVFTLARDGIQLAVNQAKEVSFGQPAWTVRVDDVQKVLDDAMVRGLTPKFTTVIRKLQGGVIDY